MFLLLRGWLDAKGFNDFGKILDLRIGGGAVTHDVIRRLRRHDECGGKQAVDIAIWFLIATQGTQTVATSNEHTDALPPLEQVEEGTARVNIEERGTGIPAGRRRGGPWRCGHEVLGTKKHATAGR